LGLGAAALVLASSSAWSQTVEPVDNTQIVVGLDNSGAATLPLNIAFDQGFFKKAGVNIDLQMLSGGTPTTMAALAGGSVTIVNLSTPALVQYAANKVINGKAFGELIEQRYDVVTTKDKVKIEDIKGANIGLSGPNAGDHIYLLGVLEHYGISPKDVTFTTAGNPVNRLAALSAGAIQATAESSPLREQSLKAGNVILKSEDSPVPSPANVYIASNDFLKNHAGLLRKFLTAQVEAIEWMRNNPDGLLPTCMRVLGATAEVCKSTVATYFNHAISGKYSWSSTFALDVDGIKSAIEVVGAIDPKAKGLTLDDVADTSIAGTTP
jgi:NitT/TauT family transport system substrate-binding protein